MTTLTMRYMRGHFIVTGPDIEPVMFKSRREARDWCTEHHPGTPIREVGANSSKRATNPKAETGVTWERIHRERIIPVGSGAPAASHRHSKPRSGGAFLF